MTDRTELMEAALDSLPDGIALFGAEGEVLFWSQAAEAILGYSSLDLLTFALPEALKPLLDGARHGDSPPGSEPQSGLGVLVRVHHKLGHEMPSISRTLILRDGLGERIGTAAVFHPAESLDALPHGETDEDEDVAASQADLEERLRTEFEDFIRGGEPFGVLWIGIDQAPELRKSHGAGACRAMLGKIQHAMAVGLRPAEELGRWGDDEFLILSHERTPEMLNAHARVLAGLARTADFRWWGDRVSLTVSIGAAQAIPNEAETLAQLLDHARNAMESSIDAGGNCVTSASRRQPCLPS
jgi:diguanylate cyclase (GGDEF)-like protein/PAS domain S-box-containing protein